MHLPQVPLTILVSTSLQSYKIRGLPHVLRIILSELAIWRLL